MEKTQFSDFEGKLSAMTPEQQIQWVERMRDALAVNDFSDVADRAEEFDVQVEMLRHRLERRRDTPEAFSEIVAGLLADGYSTLFAAALPDDPSFAADIFA
jgi:hypothetical protein